jgi:hypothetical protein
VFPGAVLCVVEEPCSVGKVPHCTYSVPEALPPSRCLRPVVDHTRLGFALPPGGCASMLSAVRDAQVLLGFHYRRV